MDYWGLSYREGMEFILRNDPSPKIRIGFFGHADQALFADGAANSTPRLEKTENLKTAKYWITTYRFHPADYSAHREIFSVVRRGEKILSVYILRDSR